MGSPNRLKLSEVMPKTTIFHKTFKSIKKWTPSWISNPLRSTVTALATPVVFSLQSGHFRSSFKMAAVSPDGQPIPWYTYPCIDFLVERDFSDKVVLEFGGGQSTLWWAEHAKNVVTLEGNLDWYNTIKSKMPPNVALHHIQSDTPENCIQSVESILEAEPFSSYDVIVIDGHYRFEMIPISLRMMSEDGMIICDNAAGYGFYEGFKDSSLMRVDFVGHTPGVLLTHDTAIYFPPNSFAFRPTQPIPAMVEHR